MGARGSFPIPLKRRLAVRLGIGLCAGAALILIAFGAWNLRLQERHLTAMSVARLSETAAVISRATREAMLRNEPHQVRTLLDSIAAQPDIVRIRVFDKQGRIQASTEAEEEGEVVDIGAEQCLSCHRAGEVLTEPEGSDRTRIFDTATRGRILGVIHPIRNEATCAGADCHPPMADKSVLGVLDVQLSTRQADADLETSQRQLALGLAGTVSAVLLLAGALVWRSVVRPVRRLAEATARVTRGDLSSRVAIEENDELGALGRAWNEMVTRLEEARGELEGWNRELADRVRAKTRELERAHQQMVLVEKMASLGKLAAVVAHEINNPLAGIATYSRLLRKRSDSPGGAGLDPAETGKILQMMEEEADRCGAIVRNLLLFSRTPGARFERHAIGPLVDRCILLLGHQAEMAEVSLEAEVGEEVPAIECDAAQVQQMIVALLSNALEATAAGGRVRVLASPESDGRGVRIVVEDDGRGIPPELADRIFEPFFTTKEETKGVGLGLAVVYGIVRRHHGTVEVDSRVAHGARMIVRLPIDQPPASETTGEAPPAAGASGGSE